MKRPMLQPQNPKIALQLVLLNPLKARKAELNLTFRPKTNLQSLNFTNFATL